MQPILVQFKKDMSEFAIERDQHTQILMRYDEIITSKASKHMVEELKMDMSRHYAKLTHANDIQE